MKLFTFALLFVVTSASAQWSNTTNLFYDSLHYESEGPYCKFYFAGNKTLVTSRTLKETEEALQDADFCRIHNSYLVNMKFVERYIRGEGGEVVLTNGKKLAISRIKKQEFLQMFERIRQQKSPPIFVGMLRAPNRKLFEPLFLGGFEV